MLIRQALAEPIRLRLRCGRKYCRQKYENARDRAVPGASYLGDLTGRSNAVSSGWARDGLAGLRRLCSPLCLYWRPASGLRPSPPFQPRRLHYLRLAPPFMHPTRRRYNLRTRAFGLYLPVFLPGLPTAFAPSYSGQFSQCLGLRLAPTAALSGRASDQLRAYALGPSSARTGDQLQLSSRAAHLTRPQSNSRLAPQATCLWQRRRLNPWLAPVVQILRQSWRPVPGSRLAAASPARAGCLPPAYFRSLSPPAESWLVFRLAPDPAPSLNRRATRNLAGSWFIGLGRFAPVAFAAEPDAQTCGELAVSTGPCIVG